jgi:Ca2+-binding RTX toxin-like protein
LLSIESTDFAFGARDVINLSAGTNAVIGGAGADEITALAGTNAILGDDGKAEFFSNGSLRLIESINLGVGSNDEITLSDGINHVIAGLGADVINVGGGRNFVHGDEGKLEVLTDGSDTTVISTLNASAGTATDIDDIDIGAGYNVVLGGAAGDTIDVNGTAADAVSSILGDNGAIVLQTSTGVLLSIESTDFDFGARDLINLSAGTNAVIGGVGADLITALAGQNTILGDDGRAQFFADGSLRLIESINLGVGSNDEITLSGGVNHVIAGLGADVIDLAAGRNFVHGDEARLEVLTDGSDTTIMSTLNASGSTGNNVDDVDIRTGYNVVFGGVDGDVIDVNDTAVDSVTTIVGDNGSLVYVTSTDVLLTIESTDFDFGGRDLINLATGTNNVIAGAAGDRVTGQSGTNTVLGDDGKAEFFTDGRLRQIESINLAMGGDDGIIFSDGNNNVIGGFGDDLIQGGLSTDVVLGDNGIAYFPTPGRLYEVATNAPAIGGIDDIDGGAGRDTLIGGAAGDLVRGGSDTDFILGDDGFVIFMTDPLFDRIPEIVKTTNPYAASDDVLYGDAGNDWIFGGPGHDEIDGGSGPDVLLGDNACYIRGSVTQGEVTFLFEFDTGVSGGDTIRGGSGNDLIYGQAGPDSLYGEAGEDSLFGGIGRDYINGGTEGDILVGGLGADFLDSGSPEHDIYFVDLYDTWVGYFDTDAIIVGDDVTTQIDWTLFSGMISVEGASRWMHALENVREQVVLSDFDNGLAGYSDEMGSLIGNLGTQSAFEDYRWVVLHRGGMEDGLGALRSEWDSTFLIGIGSYLEARTFWTGQIGW